MPFRTTSYRMTSLGEQHCSTLASLLDADHRWTAHKLATDFKSMSRNCAPHSTQHSGLLQTSSALDTPWNFRGTTMAPLCSRTGLVGLVTRGKVTTFLDESSLWTKPKLIHNEQNSSSKESAPYTMFCKGNDHCGLWHWQGNTAPCHTYKADSESCLLLHIPPTHSSNTQEKTITLVVQNLIILHDNERSHTAAVVTDFLRRWLWEILEHPPYSPNMSPCDDYLFAKVKERLRGTQYNTRESPRSTSTSIKTQNHSQSKLYSRGATCEMLRKHYKVDGGR